MEKGTVLPGYGIPEPVPIPECTHDHIVTVLPIPMSCLMNLPAMVGQWVATAGLSPCQLRGPYFILYQFFLCNTNILNRFIFTIIKGEIIMLVLQLCNYYLGNCLCILDLQAVYIN
jgi:hypothetical protein